LQLTLDGTHLLAPHWACWWALLLALLTSAGCAARPARARVGEGLAWLAGPLLALVAADDLRQQQSGTGTASPHAARRLAVSCCSC